MAKFKEFLRTGAGKLTLTISVYIIYFLIMALIGSLPFDSLPLGETALSIISVIIVVVWGYFGWKALSFIQPNIFLIMPIAGWIFYFVIKAVLGMLIGIFVLPYQIAKLILNAASR